jgi:hypothetical protein
MKRNSVTILIIVVLAAIMGLSLWYAYLTQQQSKPDFINSYETYSPRDGASPTQEGASSTGGFSEANGTIQPTGNEPAGAEKSSGANAASRDALALTGDPVGGGAFSGSGDSLKTLYVDRAKGAIYEIDTETNKATKISNVTIPGIVDFAVDSLGTTMLMKTSTTPDAETLILSTPGSAATNAQKVVLDSGVIDAVIGDAVYYIARDSVNGGSTLYKTDTHGDNRKTLWHSALTNWNIALPDNNTLTLQQKPSNGVPGYAYTFTPADKKITPILGDLPGLQVLVSPKKNFVLYTTSKGSVVSTKIRRLSTGVEITLTQPTLPEKCAWATDETFIVCGFPEIPLGTILPDEWYQGAVSFTDKLFSIDPLDASTENIVQKGEAAKIDIEKISIAPNNKHILIVDKKTGILWTLAL